MSIAVLYPFLLGANIAKKNNPLLKKQALNLQGYSPHESLEPAIEFPESFLPHVILEFFMSSSNLTSYSPTSAFSSSRFSQPSPSFTASSAS